MATTKNTRLPTSHLAPFGVRMQPELKARLEAEAEKAGRSLNSEIVSRLENSLNGGPAKAPVVDHGVDAYELIAARTMEKLLESDRFLQSIDRLGKRALEGGAQPAARAPAQHDLNSKPAPASSPQPARPATRKKS